MRRSARAARRTGHRFCRPLLGARLRRVRGATGFAADGHAEGKRGKEDARAGVRRRMLFGSASFAEPPEGGERPPGRWAKKSPPSLSLRRGKQGKVSVSPRPDRRRRQGRGGGMPIRSKESECSEQTDAEPPSPRLWRVKASEAFSEDARRPPPGGRRKRRPAPAGRRTSGAAQRRTLPSPASSRARSLTGRAEGLACRVLFLSHAA